MRAACHRRAAAILLVFAVMLSTACDDRPDAAEMFVADAWTAYRSLYIHPDGYVLDPRRDSGTVTSEGQGYALLRALWERDATTFRSIAEWTRIHLQRPDGLHAWLWSPRDGGRVVDMNTATDGDMEIAWALLMAADVFGDASYRARGAEIVRAVRTRSGLVVAPDGAPRSAAAWFPAAGNWAMDERIANLSYFVPYAHPWFAVVDPAGQWDRVTDVGYDLIDRWMADPEHALPPAFFHLAPDGSPGALAEETELETEFSFDAIRLYWRVEADCRINGRERACGDPLGVERTLELLESPEGIASAYDMGGVRLTDAESSTFYAALLPAARRVAPDAAARILEPRLDAPVLRTLVAAPDRYYDHNWVWFGLALDRGLLVERTPEPPDR